MAVRVVCPRCGAGLRAQESALGTRATCPACLAEILVPAPPQPSPPAAIPVAVRPEPPQASVTPCPQCGRAVEPLWQACPWCAASLRTPEPRRYGRPDLDVRRDSRGTRVGVIVLAVLGVVGACALLASGGRSAFGVLFFLVGAVALVVVFVRSRRKAAASSPSRPPTASGVLRRVAVGAVAVIGGVIAVVSCLGLALFAFLYSVCSSLFPR